MARFARKHLWGICAAVSAGSQYVVARFARRHTGLSLTCKLSRLQVIRLDVSHRLAGYPYSFGVMVMLHVIRMITRTVLTSSKYHRRF